MMMKTLLTAAVVAAATSAGARAAPVIHFDNLATNTINPAAPAESSYWQSLSRAMPVYANANAPAGYGVPLLTDVSDPPSTVTQQPGRGNANAATTSIDGFAMQWKPSIGSITDYEGYQVSAYFLFTNNTAGWRSIRSWRSATERWASGRRCGRSGR